MTEIALAAVVAVSVAVVGFGASLVLPQWLARRKAARSGVAGIRQDLWRSIPEARAVAFDKQGTVTTGALTVIASTAIREGFDGRDMRWFAGALGRHSEHPVGWAIAQRVPHGNVKHVKEIAGCGIAGMVDRHPVRVGTPSWIGSDASTEVGIMVAVEVDGHLMGTITVADELIDACTEVLEKLRSRHLAPVLITADSPADAKDLAGRAGIDHVIADVTPEARALAEQQLREQHGTVVVIADEGRSIQVDDAQCTLAPDANPLRALVTLIDAARALPRRRRAFQIASAALAVLAGVATFVLR